MSEMPADGDEKVIVDPDEDNLREPHANEAAQLVDATFAIAGRWLQRSDKFHSLARRNGINPESEKFRPLRRALGYFLQDEVRNGRRQVVLKSTWIVGPDSATSNPKTELAEIVEGWSELAQTVKSPGAKAHFFDLLVYRGGPNTPERAAQAISAYVDFASASVSRVAVAEENHDVPLNERDCSLSLGRALSLLHIASASPQARALASKAAAAAFQHARVGLHSSVPRVGGTVSLLAVLTATAGRLDAEQRKELSRLIRQAMNSYRTFIHVVDELAELSILLDPATREEVSRERVEARLDSATDREPMVAMIFLEEAARLAKDLHIPDLAASATRLMQDLAKEDFGFHVIETTSSIPRELMSAQIHLLSQGRDWRESLESWLQGPPPSGDADSNRRNARESMAGTLMAFLPSVHFGADNLPRWHAETEDDRLLERLGWFEDLQLATNGDLLAVALNRIAEMHGVPPLEELALFLSGNGRGDYALGLALARSLRRYWHQDFEGSLHTSAVRVEAAARRLVLLLDEPAYSVARQNNPGKYVGLSDLLEILAQRDFDESWDRFIRSLLLGPVGKNLRHDVAHGFQVAEPGPATAALALRAFSLFVVLLWRPQSLVFPARKPPFWQPSWTIVDAAVSAIGSAGRSPAMIPRLMRIEAAAVWSHLKSLFWGRN
ncbi:hypothetical protein [Micromonospora echinospora]